MGPAVAWLALGEDALPAGAGWLSAGEAARAAGLRYPKRRTEYLLRRLVAKHAVALVLGRSTHADALAAIDVRNAPSGAPYVVVDGVRASLDISLTDRAGWAACAVAPPCGGVGCDLELVEPRTDGFRHTFLTAAERRQVAAQPAGVSRDAAVNLIWSAKESALKVLTTGLRLDAREVEARPDLSAADGWAALAVRVPAGSVLSGWWRRDGDYLLTVVAAQATPPPVALGDPDALATARARHSWHGRQSGR
jgi:4'-phosphopantetheinyl transferase